MLNLTEEQAEILKHPRGQHGRILAVAGSGKTTTVAELVRKRIVTDGVNPQKICILMFNRKAREYFEKKISDLIQEDARRPPIYTFHKFAKKIISKIERKKIVDIDYWVEDKEEMVRRTAIEALKIVNAPPATTSDELLKAIGIYKAELIPAEFAGHKSDPWIPRAFIEFEKIRKIKRAISYDDFVPVAIEVLENEPSIARDFVSNYELIVIDEYQDINYGQHRLVEMIAGNTADVIAVGDDDQTIYEWRGARSEYIRDHFKKSFTNKPSREYLLTESFRFGPLIAQTAQNLIRNNRNRAQKNLVSNNRVQNTEIHLFGGDTKRLESAETNKQLVNEILAVTSELDAKFGEELNLNERIVVLGRTYAQLTGIEAEMMHREVPYRVVGKEEISKRREVRTLLQYLRIGLNKDVMVDQHLRRCFEDIINVPNRRLSKKTISGIFNDLSGSRVSDFVAALKKDSVLKFFSRQENKESLIEFADSIERILDATSRQAPAHAVINDLILSVDYYGHFDDYYGLSEESLERKSAVNAILNMAKKLEKYSCEEFLKYVDDLDSTFGQADENLVTLTTPFRVKGDEFDYVFIPDCVEGYMPCEIPSPDDDQLDTRGRAVLPSKTPAIESERRLFYVALTRAKKAVFIGAPYLIERPQLQTKTGTSRFISEMMLEETRVMVEAIRGNPSTSDHELRNALTQLKLTYEDLRVIKKFYLPGLQDIPSVGEKFIPNNTNDDHAPKKEGRKKWWL